MLNILAYNSSIAYIGPGAGFAFLGSFLILFTAVLLAVLSMLTLPVRFAISSLLRRKKRTKSSVKRVIVLGLDGLDPSYAKKLMEKDYLPNMQRLRKEGTFSELNTTCPSISPVAWSSFSTGVNPGKHNIFDFLNRNLRTYIPELSSSKIQTFKKPGLFGKKTSEMKLLRKSIPFWKILGDHGIFSTILRVPITFPPEKFYGLSLSAMCTPDIQGTQGSFTCYETESAKPKEVSTNPEAAGGERITVSANNGRIETYLPGPPSEPEQLKTPLIIQQGKDDSITVKISGEKLTLKKGKYSDWTKVHYQAGLFKIHGICKFLLISSLPDFKLYVTPVNIDPEQPAMPVSHPTHYSTYLSKLIGPFATLGLAEDTWALSEGVISDKQFIKQVWDIHEEREKMFFESIKRTREGVCCCVFDASDRIQHMFYRYADDTHPARKTHYDQECEETLNDMYKKMDELVGRTMKEIGKNDILFILSDHGFSTFRRGINLNKWLEKKGYLTLKENTSGAEYLVDVDWSKTKVYGFGLSGIYLNLENREAKGIVNKEEASALKKEIIRELQELMDPETNETAIKGAYDAEEIFSGPYSNNGPDIVVGYKKGYRASWGTAAGEVKGEVFEDNTEPWSGDHCIDYNLVPGVFFSTERIASKNGFHIMDIAPTILNLFGVQKPKHMDGTPFTVNKK